MDRHDLAKDETFGNHKLQRHPLHSYLNFFIFLRFTLDDDADTAAGKVVWFQFDNIYAYRLLQTKLTNMDSSFLPSFMLNSHGLALSCPHQINRKIYNQLNKEWGDVTIWDIANPPKCVREAEMMKLKEERKIQEDKDRDKKKEEMVFRVGKILNDFKQERQNRKTRDEKFDQQMTIIFGELKKGIQGITKNIRQRKNK